VRRLLTDVKDMLREQVVFRELLYQLVRRDLLLRYKQSVMGFGWAIFMPLVNTIIFSIVFTRAAKIDVSPLPYPLFAYCGLLAWNLSASAWRFSVASMTSNVNLVTKVYFPREMFPFSAVIVATVDSLVGAVLLAGLMVYYGIAPGASIVLLPAVLIVQLMLTTGLALLLAMANLHFRDVKYLFEIVLTVGMFVTAVLYPAQSVGGLAGALIQLNPMSIIVEAYRDILLRGLWPDAQALGVAAAMSAILLGAGWLWFHRAEFTFAENI
jgi:ABC-2 type transport system permease protein/lipopolysaccharide transport system permease protein